VNIDKIVIKKFLEKSNRRSRMGGDRSKSGFENPSNSPRGVSNNREEPPSPEENAEAIPRTIYLNSKASERNLDKLRDKMRVNQFSHLNFNAFYGSRKGRQYFKGAGLTGNMMNSTGGIITRSGSKNKKGSIEPPKQR
jgi:hypothetical protein